MDDKQLIQSFISTCSNDLLKSFNKSFKLLSMSLELKSFFGVLVITISFLFNISSNWFCSLLVSFSAFIIKHSFLFIFLLPFGPGFIFYLKLPIWTTDASKFDKIWLSKNSQTLNSLPVVLTKAIDTFYFFYFFFIYVLIILGVFYYYWH
jgi:hypothetical protein